MKTALLPSAVHVLPARLEGRVRLPISKSLAHRRLFALFLAAAFEEEKDGRARAAFAQSVEKLRASAAASSDDLLATAVVLERLAAGSGDLDCRESGTTLRFVIPVAAALGAAVTVRGAGRLPERPLGEYEALLSGRGVKLNYPEASQREARRYLPLGLSGQLTAGEFRLPGHVSSQYLSGLLLALPLLPGDSVIWLESPLESAAYVRLTLDELDLFAVRVDFDPEMGLHGAYRIKGGQRYRLPAVVPELEADESQAAFFHLANFLGQAVQVEGLNPQTRQGDAIFLRLLADLNTLREELSLENRLVPRKEPFSQSGLALDVSQFPDLVPALALACAVTPGTHRLYNAGRLRIKESDRLNASAEMLRSLGIRHEELETELLIYGLEKARGALLLEDGSMLPLWFEGGKALTFHDHRLMMCLCIAGSQAEGGIEMDDTDCVRKSYPAFLRDFTALGGRVRRGEGELPGKNPRG